MVAINVIVVNQSLKYNEFKNVYRLFFVRTHNTYKKELKGFALSFVEQFKIASSPHLIILVLKSSIENLV